jgi:hypothetical protein
MIIEKKEIYVLECYGKCKGTFAEEFKLLKFDSKKDAEKFIQENEDLESKYWTAFQYIKIGIRDDIYFNN